MMAPLLLASCMEDEEVTLSDDCYISSVSLGTLKRKIYASTSEGQDSVYTTTLTGTSYVMTIDQRMLTIQNLDSLPVNVQLGSVLATVGFEGVLVWRKADLSQQTDTTWHTYSSSDSLDLTEPLRLRVYPASANSSRTYTLKVNVHQQNGDSTTWNHIGKANALTGSGKRRATTLNERIMVLTEGTTGTLTYTSHPLSAQGEWTTSATTGTENANVESMQKQGNRLLMSTTDGNVIESSNGTNWTPTTYPTLSGLQLVAASDDRLYALAAGKLYSSNGGTWTEEALDDESNLLPTDNLQSVYMAMGNGYMRLTLVGSQNSTDKAVTIWAKSWANGQENSATWMYYTPNNSDKFHCPMMENLCILPYDDGLQALGGKSKDGRYAALDSIFHSNDYGITWKTYADNDMLVDSSLRTTAQGAQYITATVDKNNYLWILVDDEVWRGRINRLGFLRKDI